MTVPTSSRSGKKTSKVSNAGFDQLADNGGGQFLIGVDHHFAGRHIDHVGGDEGAFEIVDGDFDLRDLVLDDFRIRPAVILRPCGTTASPAFVVDGVRQLQADQVVVDLPEQFGVFDADLRDAVERAQDLLVGFETERAQKDRTVEFALAVDTYVEQILVVVLEFDPAAAIRNDLAEVVALRRNALEEDAGRTVQLADDHALGAVDDERAVVRHQRNFAEEDFLFLDVANALLRRFRRLWRRR